MGWKRAGFQRRIRELAAECDADGRVYPSLEEMENECAYNWDHIWRCLSRAWRAGRAMGKAPLELRDEAEKWLAEIGVHQPSVVSQAFIDVKVGHRVWNSKCEVSRFDIASDVLNASERGAAHRGDELLAWYSDIVAEWADIHKTRSLPTANHAVMEWTETAGILSRLWSLYEGGMRTIEDRNTLKALVVGITNIGDQQAEAWIRARESLEEHSPGRAAEDQDI